jgi:hypothetical protein
MDINSARNKLTYFHIPKTGGRFLSANTIDIFKADLINRDISIVDKVGKSRHQSFYYLDIDELSKPMVTLRNPVDRTISHYFYILANKLTGDINQDKIAFFNYINSDRCELNNYQARYICSNLPKLDLLDSDLPAEVDLDLINLRLSKVFYLIKTENINKDLCKNILLDSYKDHKIDPNMPLVEQVFSKEFFVNPESKLFKNSLSKQEIKNIENIVKIDMDIYETSRYFLEPLV